MLFFIFPNFFLSGLNILLFRCSFCQQFAFIFCPSFLILKFTFITVTVTLIILIPKPFQFCFFTMCMWRCTMNLYHNEKWIHSVLLLFAICYCKESRLTNVYIADFEYGLPYMFSNLILSLLTKVFDFNVSP